MSVKLLTKVERGMETLLRGLGIIISLTGIALGVISIKEFPELPAGVGGATIVFGIFFLCYFILLGRLLGDSRKRKQGIKE